RHVTRGVYREVVPNRKVVFTWQWEGTDNETLVTVQLRAKSPRETELTLKHERFADSATRDHHDDGWTRCLSKLESLYAA
ncbi:MAG TPA: SRPBCC domain-containing protein, partial [Gammaproteobacteria bacterium]|nr:SRPBCC domain-containing protein [Gammaproteobacteria bacterium]